MALRGIKRMLGIHKENCLKLNLGSGNKKIEGYTNVDLDGNADINADVCDIPIEDETVSEILAIHILEHLERWLAPKALKEWFRLLKPGGLLIIELPDLIKCCENLIAGVRKEDSIYGLYGDPTMQNPLMCHRWAYSNEELSSMLKEVGFVNIEEKKPVFHCGKKRYRDMRIEAQKPNAQSLYRI